MCVCVCVSKPMYIAYTHINLSIQPKLTDKTIDFLKNQNKDLSYPALCPP